MTLEPLAEDLAVEPQVVHDMAAVIREGDSFLIAGHLRPDGDCLGTGLGLYHMLVQLGKKARFYTAGPLPDFLEFLPGFDRIETETPTQTPPTIIYVDSGDPSRVNEEWLPQGFILNIDHHLSNSNFGNLNWVDTEAAAAAEQIYRLGIVLGVEFTPEIATCLYTGLFTDSGGFRYGNTDSVMLAAAGHLARCGADPATIATNIFDSRKPQSVRLIGTVYQSLNYEFGGQFVWAEITQELYNMVGGDTFEPEGLSSDIRGIAGVEVAALFHETPEGWCRIGMRSKRVVNVSELATMLGGGGHFNASGAYIREPYAPTRDRALATMREYFARSLGPNA